MKCDRCEKDFHANRMYFIKNGNTERGADAIYQFCHSCRRHVYHHECGLWDKLVDWSHEKDRPLKMELL